MYSIQNSKWNMLLSVVRRKCEHTSDLWFTRHQMCLQYNWNAMLEVQSATNSIVISTFLCNLIFVLLWLKWMSLRSCTSSMLYWYITARQLLAAIITALYCHRLGAGTRWMMAWFVLSLVWILCRVMQCYVSNIEVKSTAILYAEKM